MTEQRVQLLKSKLRSGIENKFTKNFGICSFYLICPKNGQPMQITYNTFPVGIIENGKMTVNEFVPKVWGRSNYKYDLLLEIQNEFHPKSKVDGKKGNKNKK